MKKIISFTKKIINNDYLFSVIAKVFGLGISIVLSALTARFFGAELKGISAVVENNVSLYSVFIGLGVYQAYPFFRKKEPDIYQTYINNISTMFVLLEVLAILIASFMFKNSLNTYLALSIILIPVEVFIKQLNYVVLIENPRRRNASSLIISTSEIFVIGVLWLFFDANVITVLAYYCISLVLNLILSFINLRMNPMKIRPDVSRLIKFVRFGFIPMLVYLCMSINYKIDIQMLKWFKNVQYADVGIYATGVALATKIWLIPDAIKDILLSKLVKGKNEDEVARVLRINVFICVVCIILLIAVGKPAILMLYGAEFALAYPIMILMLVGVLAMIFYKMIYSYNISRGKRAINLLFLGLAAVVNVIGNCLLIPIWGIFGAAAMSVISYTLCGLCFLIYFKKVTRIPYKKLIIIQHEDFDMIKKILMSK